MKSISGNRASNELAIAFYFIAFSSIRSAAVHALASAWVYVQAVEAVHGVRVLGES